METPLSHLFDEAYLARHPFSASLELTHSCNLACRFCYNPIQRPNQLRIKPLPKHNTIPLSFGEISDLLDQFRSMGILYFTATGGEPLLHPRFWDIVGAAKERSFAVRIFTNGTLIDETAADCLAELCPYCLEFSIHGATEESAVALNQTPGSHQAQLKALGLLRDRGIRVFLKCVVTKLVENELDAVKAVGERFGFPVFFDPVLTMSDDGQEYPLDLTASDDALYRLYSSHGLNVGNSPFEREPGQYNCAVGGGILHVDPYGNVQPCVQWKRSIGNIRERSLKAIWETSDILEKVRAINLAAATIIKEKVVDHAYCRHCPALSDLRTGDPLEPEEQCLRLARIRRRVAKDEQLGDSNRGGGPSGARG